MTMDRRGFLTAVGGASLVWPRSIEALARDLATGGAQDDEAFWSLVRQQFLVPADRIYLNNGTLGPSPRVVVDAVAEHTRRVAQTFPPGVAWSDLKKAAAHLLGGDPDGFVFPRNTTEAMNFVANGIELEALDDVVSTDHEHIGGIEPWKLITRRRGASLTIARLPVPAMSSDDLADAVWEAVTPATRVLCVSHMTFTTGTVLPVHELADRCRAQGVIFAVDGAHPPGMLSMDIGALGADFYATSPHKWLLAAQGTGLLYIHESWRERLWPTLASGGWDDLSLGAQRFNHMGTMDESRLAGLLASLDFVQALGPSRIEARIRHLRGLLETGLREIPGVTVGTPEDESLKGGMVSFAIDGVESADLQRHLSQIANVRTRVIGEYGYGWMRLSTHVYNAPSEIEHVLGLLAQVASKGIPT